MLSFLQCQNFFYSAKTIHSRYLTLLLGLGITIAEVTTAPVLAQQVRSDGTLNTVVNSPNHLNFTITGGTIARQNLFHSFNEFSIPTNGSATFDVTNAPGISSIFTRVTGNQASNINGTIRTIGGNQPNVFLMNPNGILFGPQAKLEIGGSFLGTTAQGIKFDDGVQFDRNTPSAALLNVQVPIGLQIAPNAAAIQVQGSGYQVTNPDPQLPYQITTSTPQLQVKSGQTLGLLGGDINVAGGRLSGDQIAIGAVNSSTDPQTVGLQLSSGRGFQFDYSQVSQYGQIQLKQQSLIDISGSKIGRIQLQAKDISLLDGSILLAQTSGAQGGLIQLIAQDRIFLDGSRPDRIVGSGINVYAINSGEGASIDISAQDLIICERARISSQAFGQASVGDIRIQAGRSVIVNAILKDPNEVKTASTVAAILALTRGHGSSGDIQIQTPHLQVTQEAVISAATYGSGNAGNVILNIDHLEINTGGIIGSSSFVSGNAGQVNIQTRLLDLRNGGLISSNSLGRGNAGTININASESIALTGEESEIRSTVRNASSFIQRQWGSPATATGNGGSIVIRSPQINLDQQAQINVRNEGIGAAGEIDLKTQELNLDRGSSLNGATRVAAGGNIRIQSEFVGLRRGSRINVTAGNRGKGGEISIDTGILVGLENSDIVANAVLGNGGQIQIKADQIYGLEYRSQLTPGNDITAISQFGINGSVAIQDLRLELHPETFTLPFAFSDQKQQISDKCEISGKNRFIITGRGGLPKTPSWNLDSNRAWRDIRELKITPPITETNLETIALPPAQPKPKPAPLIEASNWRQNQDGSIELIAPGSQNQSFNIAARETCAIGPLFTQE